MAEILYPSLYQVNTRVMITELSGILGRPATLDDIPDDWLDKLAAYGFDWIWLLSVWQTGKEGQRISRQNARWRKEFRETLPDLLEEDIAGSGFAIVRYTVSKQLGGDAALARLRKRLSERGLKMMLDFVPNHTGTDHDWVNTHTDYFVRAEESNLKREPENYIRISTNHGDVILAHGRDPYFPGWSDTLQLNYGNPDLQEAMKEELLRIAGQCDGVRCDMAMLLLPDVFEKTWGIGCKPFWPEAIKKVRDVNKSFCFMAEVYWDLEWTLLQQGFDYTYDKRLYDRLKEANSRQVREHFFASMEYQGKMARFLENHDEPRAAADFPSGMHEAAAIITFLSPGLRFFHQGQLQGKIKRISPHLVRGPKEPVNEELEIFYNRLLDILKMPLLREGNWQLLNCTAAWDKNWSNYCFIAFAWQGHNDDKIVAAINYSPNQSQCYIKLPFQEISSGMWELRDLLTGKLFERDGSELQSKGLYLDEPAWKTYVFTLRLSKPLSS